MKKYMSVYTRILSSLGAKEANRMNIKLKEQERKCRDVISKLSEEKKYLLSIIAQNVEDIASIKQELVEVNKKLSRVLTQNKEANEKIRFIEKQDRDFGLIIESFLEKYPNEKLSDIVLEKNKKKID